MSKITIVIADDHKLVREAWTEILEKDPLFKVVATCGDSAEAIAAVKDLQPDIVLMDIHITPFSGVEATEKIRKISPLSGVIGVSMYSKPEYAKKMLNAGAKGYVTKTSSREEMFEAILEVNAGNKYLCSEIKNIISDRLLEGKNPTPTVDMLTEREMEIINKVKKGFSSKEIANALVISMKTVEVHRHNILKKLNLKNSAALVNFINTSMVDF